MGLRFRLNLMISLTLLLIVGAGAAFAIHNARRSVLEEGRSSVNLALQLIDAGLARNRESELALMGWLRELSSLDQTRHLHLQVEQAPERIIHLAALSRSPPSAAPSWFVWAVTPPLLVGEKRVEGPDGAYIRIVVEANPSDEIDEAWTEASGFLTLMIALALAVSVLVHVTLGRAFKSVNVILKALEAIEQGDYSQRLRAFALPEFDRIALALNHMAATLQQARDDNRALSQQSLAIQEEERRHIARELHDELGQSVSAVRLMAASLRTCADPRQFDETIQAILGACDRLFDAVRGLMRRMRPQILDDLGLGASLDDMLATWRRGNADIHVEFDFEPEVEHCAPGTHIHLFRIVQECMTNIVKHAQASAVTICLKRTQAPPRLRLVIEDDGVGFDPQAGGQGFGLHGVRERVANLGGEFQLRTAPGQGVRISVAIPYRGDAA